MKKRKIIATALMAGLVLSSSSTYAADLTGFKDAPQVGSSAYESLNYAVEKGYLAGIDGELKAEKTLTRAELAAIVVRAYGKDAVASNLSQFKDVKKDAWYYEELAKAYSKGYIKGKSATIMAPNETVSQLEALVIIARASGHTSGSQADLAGISEKVPSWAVSSIGSLVKAGVIKADGNGKLNLSAKMTRGNFADAVYKADKSIDNRTQEDNAKNAKKGDTNNPLDKNGKNPYLPAPGSSSSGSSASQTLTWYYGDANVDQRYYPSNTGDAFIHPPFFNAHIGIGVDENGIIREIVDNDTAKRSGNEEFWNRKQKSYWLISNRKINDFVGKNLEQVKAMRMGHGGADIISGATSNGLALQEAIINALEKKNTDKEAILGKKVLPDGAKLTAQAPVVSGSDVKISFSSTLPADFDLKLHSVRYGSTNEEALADSAYTWDGTSKTLTLKAPKAGKYFVNIVDASGKWRSPNFESRSGINYPYAIVEASASDKVMSFSATHQLQTANGQMDNIYKNIEEVVITELDKDGNVVMVERTNKQGQKVTVPNTIEIERYGHHGNINTSFDIISATGQLNLNATNRGKKIFENNKRFKVEMKVYGYGEVKTEVNNLQNPPSPQPQTKADKFKAEIGNVPTLRTSIVTDKLVLEVEEKSKITADRVAKALDTEGKRPTYGYIDVSIKTDVDRSSVGQKEAVASLKFNDNSELEVKIPVEVEGLPVVYLHPSIKLSSALSGKEYEVGENLDLNGMKVLVPFAKELKADGTWDETAAAQLVYVEYKDLGVADIKVVKKGTTTEFVNNSPITADMIEDGKIALEVYKENIVSKDPEAAHRQPIKGLKAKATTPQPQTKADKFKAEMGNVPTLRTSIVTDKLVLEVEEKSKITADRVSKALDTEGKRPTYGYIDVSIKTDVDRSSVGQKEAVATLKFNDNSELEVKIPVEVEGLPVVYLHPSIKLSSALSGKEYEVGENLDLNGMKVLVPFAKELKADGTWDETAAAQLVYVEYKDLGVADIKVVKKGTTTEFVNNSPITADMIEDGKIALEVYKENIVSKDPEAAHRQPIKGLKAKATAPALQGHEVVKEFRMEQKDLEDAPSAAFLAKYGTYYNDVPNTDPDGRKENYFEIGRDYTVKLDIKISADGKLEAIVPTTAPSDLGTDKRFWKKAERFFNGLVGKTEDEIKAIKTWREDVNDKSNLDGVSSATITGHAGHLEILEAFKEYRQKNNLG